MSAAAAAGDGGFVARTAAAELAAAIGDLRAALAGRSGGTEADRAPVHPADAPAPEEGVPIIVLNAGDSSDGFSWRAGSDRVEIYGDSPKGLLNGVYDFLGALGLRWDTPGPPILPAMPSPVVVLPRSGAYEPDAEGSEVSIPAERPGSRLGATTAELIRWAASGKASAVYLADRRRARALDERTAAAARDFGVEIEIDGPRPYALVPRVLFPFKPDLFSMEGGRRSFARGFCPTNPNAIRIAKERAGRFFRAHPGAAVYRFEAASASRCACPACRAFAPAEQTLMAANAVAEALARERPGARLSVDLGGEETLVAAVAPRENVLVVRRRER